MLSRNQIEKLDLNGFFQMFINEKGILSINEPFSKSTLNVTVISEKEVIGFHSRSKHNKDLLRFYDIFIQISFI